ncbi:hypothetical protein GOP47_0023670 [Adiantum capillus-veneris]|uniref:RRM domain-containing protein n=1 Tax=Adiantum capillus-veneris TaxID=13818 RepID=A0A9D4Z4S2_ADICA|nr:hypothetical protein GOP47_0023670 [Adiantum capillus-veneris]
MAVIEASSAVAISNGDAHHLDESLGRSPQQMPGSPRPACADPSPIQNAENVSLDFENGSVEYENGSPGNPSVFENASSGSSASSEGQHDNGFHHHDTMRELEDMFSKLNPNAKEFVPPSHSPDSLAANNVKNNANRKKKNGYVTNKRRINSRLLRAQRDDSIRRTVYVSDIDQQVTEEQLAALFLTCGQVVDCRVCGDPNSVLRFAFVEFTDEEGARRALSLAGTMLGFYPVRVLPSKTAIVPVNPTFLPQSEDEREMCARTIYCTNIDKKVSQAEVKLFFESLCGQVARLRLLGDYRHSTRIAFVEFNMAESAIAALNCSGAILGLLPIRVSPSKTPVRPCMTRPFLI